MKNKFQFSYRTNSVKEITTKILNRKSGLMIILALCFLTSPHLKSQEIETVLKEIEWQPDGNPKNLTPVDNGFYFISQNNYLWFSDGTVSGTQQINSKDTPLYELANLTPVGNQIYFSAKSTSNSPHELWMADLTSGTIIQLTNRSVSLRNDSSIRSITAYKDRVYFAAHQTDMGNELWTSDGTIDGTHFFKDIRVGSEGSYPKNMMVFQDKLFFVAFTMENGTELWTSDGTSEGTLLFKDINPNGSSLSYDPIEFIQGDGHFYFYADDGENGLELWKSNGTETGTMMVKNIHPRGSSNIMLKGVYMNGKIFFIAFDDSNIYRLWSSDGTEEGTTFIDQFNFDWYKSELVATNNKIFVMASNDNSQSGIWVTDGTSEGSEFVSDLYTHSFGVFADRDEILFYAPGNTQGEVLWISNGTKNGTRILSENVFRSNSSHHESTFISYKDQVFFTGDNQVNGFELWKTDGSNEGTDIFKDLNYSLGVNPTNGIQIGDNLFFSSLFDGRRSLSVYNSVSKEVERFPIYVEGAGTGDKTSFLEFNGELVFVGSDGNHGYELFISDGTLLGTKMIKDIFPGPNGAFKELGTKLSLTKIGDKIYFSAESNTSGTEIWVSDGSESGTYMIKDIEVGGSSYPSNFTLFNDEVYFVAFGRNGRGVFKTDGTANGTEEVIPFSKVGNIKMVNNKLLIIAETSGTTYGPHDLWVSDGTYEGTSQIASYGDGIGSSIEYMTTFNDELYFVAKQIEDPNSFGTYLGKGLFKTDGTIEGTKLMVSIGRSNILDFITSDDYLYFGVTEPNSSYLAPSRDLWRSDGTVQGTIALYSDSYGQILNFKEMNNVVYATVLTSPNQLLVTKGNIEETHLLQYRSRNGSLQPVPSNMRLIGAGNNQLFLNGTTEESGPELYLATPSKIGINDQFPDSDDDQVADFFDQCPNTEEGTTVDDLGCSNAFILAEDNFLIQSKSETCLEESNGMIMISAKESEYNYQLNINGDVLTFNDTLEIQNLMPGNYDLCISVEGQDDFEQCFSIEIYKANYLLGKSTSNKVNQRIYEHINISAGTAPFTASLNGIEVLTTRSTHFFVEVSEGDILEVHSKYACEGSYRKNISLGKEIQVYPNPVTNQVKIQLQDGDARSKEIMIFNTLGEIVLKGNYPVYNRQLVLPLEQLTAGVYMIKLSDNNKAQIIKIIKS